jgi:hypothetical protein
VCVLYMHVYMYMCVCVCVCVHIRVAITTPGMDGLSVKAYSMAGHGSVWQRRQLKVGGRSLRHTNVEILSVKHPRDLGLAF